MAISVGVHGLQCLCGDIANDVVTETCVSLGGETYVHSLEPVVRGPSSRGTLVAVSTLGAQILISKYHSPKKKKKEPEFLGEASDFWENTKGTWSILW